MTMYKWLDTDKSVRRLVDGAVIPNAAGNSDWVRFQEWVAEGNTPQPADQPPPPLDLSNSDNVEKALKAVLGAAALMSGKTGAQAKAAFKQAWDSLP
jgi:hypothetical protein